MRASRIAERTGVDETKIGASAFASFFPFFSRAAVCRGRCAHSFARVMRKAGKERERRLFRGRGDEPLFFLSLGTYVLRTAHILRLLATHHVVREAAPDAFAMNRVSSLLDTGKAFDAVVAWCVSALARSSRAWKLMI